MNTLQMLEKEYSNKLEAIMTNKEITQAEKFVQMAALKNEYQEPILKAFLAYAHSQVADGRLAVA